MEMDIWGEKKKFKVKKNCCQSQIHLKQVNSNSLNYGEYGFFLFLVGLSTLLRRWQFKDICFNFGVPFPVLLFDHITRGVYSFRNNNFFLSVMVYFLWNITNKLNYHQTKTFWAIKIIFTSFYPCARNT